MHSLLRIITFAVSIIMSLLPIITIIAYYYVFETGQLADGGGGRRRSCRLPVRWNQGVHHCGSVWRKVGAGAVRAQSEDLSII